MHHAVPDPPDQATAALDALSTEASTVGREIVEVSGTLDAISAESEAQIDALHDLQAMAERIVGFNQAVERQSGDVHRFATASTDTIGGLVDEVRRSAASVQNLARWVDALAARVNQVETMLKDVRKSNTLIGDIAAQVNILAINAKIEAARAGDAGRGFAVVAEAVNDLSKKTRNAASDIQGQITNLGEWVGELADDARTYARVADAVQNAAQQSENAMDQMRQHIGLIETGALGIGDQVNSLRDAARGFSPSVERIGAGARETGQHIHDTRVRLHGLIDTSERLVQGIVAAGGSSNDQAYIDRATDDAAHLGRLLEQAVDRGDIAFEDLFVRTYAPIADSDPKQVMAPFTALTDRLFPAVQEAALDFDPKVIFCAAVDRNGYLPTHNHKFSRPQGADPVWNAANARNRRIFDDRVGLKAGRNTRPFLLQVYRRDMGGGEYRIMKDLSAPILVKGRHWGGLRLAYSF